MPGWTKEDKHDAEKKAPKAAMKTWLVGLAKKKKDGAPEEPSAAGPEPVLVRFLRAL